MLERVMDIKPNLCLAPLLRMDGLEEREVGQARSDPAATWSGALIGADCSA